MIIKNYTQPRIYKEKSFWKSINSWFDCQTDFYQLENYFSLITLKFYIKPIMWFLNSNPALIIFFGILNFYLPFFNSGILMVTSATGFQCENEYSFTSNILKFVLGKYQSKLMTVGMPEIQLPPLEPLKINSVHFETKHPEFGNLDFLDLKNVTLRKLSTFKIDKACMFDAGQKIIVKLSIPKVLIDAFYNISGIIGHKYIIRGSGPMNFELNNFEVSAKIFIGLGIPLSLKEFDIDFSIESIKSDLNQLYGKESVSVIMNQVIERIFPEAIVLLKPEILPPIRELLAERINNTLGTIRSLQLSTVILKFASIL